MLSISVIKGENREEKENLLPIASDQNFPKLQNNLWRSRQIKVNYIQCKRLKWNDKFFHLRRIP